MAFFRTLISDFILANEAYVGASVSFFTVLNGAKTATLATLYENPTGTDTVANPQILDAEGKFSAPVYIEVPVIASISGISIGDHDTGIIRSSGDFRGDWVTATVYNPGDFVRDGANGNDTKDLYIVTGSHTSGTFATDAADSTKLAIVLDMSDLATVLPTPSNPADDGKVAQASAGAFIVGPLITSAAATLLDDASIADIRTTLLLGTAALVNTGTGAGEVPTADVADLQGLNQWPIRASDMRPTVSNGCAFLTDVETTAGRPDLQVLDFDASADEHAQFSFAFPKRWNRGTITFRVYWTSTATDTDGVAWGLQAVAVGDNDTADVAFGTAVVVTDDNQGAAEDINVSAVSAALTVGGTPAVGDWIFFDLFRDVSDANDDMTEDARLVGIDIFWTSDEGTDA